MDQAFDKDVTSYHAYVDKNAEGVTVKAQGKDTKYTLKVNGEVGFLPTQIIRFHTTGIRTVR